MKKLLVFMGIFALILPLMFLGCEGDDGATGATGAQGPAGPPGDPGAGAAVQPESCSVCHNGNLARDGITHQESYDELYQDGVIVITNLAYANDNVSDIVTFNMTKAGANFDCTELDSWEESPAGTGSSLGIYFTEYDSTNRSFDQPAPLTGRLSIGNAQTRTTASTLSYDAGTNLCTSTKAQSAAGDLSGLNGLVVVYGRNEARNAEEESPELEFTRVVQAKYPFAASLTIGTVAYASAANVAGCERCHTVPFLKHGYIYGQVDGDPATQFFVCKGCHLDNGSGSHEDWQVLVNDPPRAASLLGYPLPAIPLTPAEEAQYAYRTTLMNDVHMSHAMEFPYPMSMSNCVACHEGKLTTAVLTEANFTGETCLSCHPETGGTDLPDANGDFTVDTINDPHQAPPLTKIWVDAGVDSFHAIDLTCNDSISCHAAGTSGSTFTDLHTGYDKTIYGDAIGTKYSSAITASIDNASFAPVTKQLTFSWSATGSLGGVDSANIVPTVLVGLYGYDTKDYVQGPHESDPLGNQNSPPPGERIRDLRALEYNAGSDSITGRNSLYITDNGGGSFTVDLGAVPQWAGWIDNNTVKKVEIAVLPRLENADNVVVALDAPSRTFDLGANAFVANYYSGTNAIVRVDTGCNNCHDALADTFHSPERGGNIVVCRLCHITKDAGSHLEMQSRSIDSYAHGIHSFQPFDIGNVEFDDPVEALHYEEHIRFAFPTLGRTNCEACHNPGKYNVPDESKTLSGVLSGSDPGVIFNNLQDFPNGPRNIGDVARYVAGPAARACGGCHRVNWINKDQAGELAAFYSHTRTFGYLVETTSTTSDADALTVIDAIQSMI